jgi:hypothetical protein
MNRALALTLLVSSVALGCGSRGLSAPDGGADHPAEQGAPEVPPGGGGPFCPGAADFSCISYTQAADGKIRCHDITTSPICFEGIWMCPPGFAHRDSCACFYSGTPACPCADGGCTDGPVTDSPSEASGCIGDPKASCLTIRAMCGPTFLVCDDVLQRQVCDGGTWRCPDLTVEASKCGYSGAIPPGCHCTSTGIECTDGGSTDAADALCADVGCELDRVSGTFCKLNEVQWICHGPNANLTPFIQSCRDAATNAVRYCCPPSFRSSCLGG